MGWSLRSRSSPIRSSPNMVRLWQWRVLPWTVLVERRKRTITFAEVYETILNRMSVGTCTVCCSGRTKSMRKPSNATGMRSSGKRTTSKFCVICRCCRYRCGISRDTEILVIICSSCARRSMLRGSVLPWVTICWEITKQPWTSWKPSEPRKLWYVLFSDKKGCFAEGNMIVHHLSDNSFPIEKIFLNNPTPWTVEKGNIEWITNSALFLSNADSKNCFFFQRNDIQ